MGDRLCRRPWWVQFNPKENLAADLLQMAAAVIIDTIHDCGARRSGHWLGRYGSCASSGQLRPSTVPAGVKVADGGFGDEIAGRVSGGANRRRLGCCGLWAAAR